MVLESQVKNMLATLKKDIKNKVLLCHLKEAYVRTSSRALIIEELQLQMGRQAGIRVGDGELNQAFENMHNTMDYLLRNL